MLRAICKNFSLFFKIKSFFFSYIYTHFFFHSLIYIYINFFIANRMIQIYFELTDSYVQLQTNIMSKILHRISKIFLIQLIHYHQSYITLYYYVIIIFITKSN